MEPIKFLQKLKAIEPNREYTEKSKVLILATLPHEAPTSTFWFLFIKGMRAGSTALVSGLLILLLVSGGFLAGKLFAPLTLGSLDPKTLKAEADLIDIQIKLSTIGDYQEENRTIALPPKPKTIAPPATNQNPVSAPQSHQEATSSPTKEINLDNALEVLSQ